MDHQNNGSEGIFLVPKIVSHQKALQSRRVSSYKGNLLKKIKYNKASADQQAQNREQIKDIFQALIENWDQINALSTINQN